MPTEQITVYDPSGASILAAFGPRAWFRLDLARSVNHVGVLVWQLPPDTPLSYFPRDGQIAVECRSGDGPLYLDGGTRWLIVKRRRVLESGGKSRLEITAMDGVDLLRRRIVAANSGSSQADKTGAADTLITTIISEQCGSSASSVRQYANFTVNTASGSGASVSKAFSRRNVLLVCQEIAQSSTTAGTYIAFDVVWSGSGWEVRTYPNYRGVDRRWPTGFSPVILSPENGSLITFLYEEDYTDEITMAYAGGQDTGAARVIATAQDTIRSALSPYALIEAFIDARGTDAAAQVQDEADAGLRAGRPRITVEAELTDAPQALFGRDYGFGDVLTAQYDAMGVLFDCRLDAYRRVAEGGKDRISGVLRSVT